MKRLFITTNALFGFMLFLPLIQRSVSVLPRFPLYGAEPPPPRPALTWSHWLSGTYAVDYEARHAARLSIRPHLVRTDNQISYSLFGQVARRSGTQVVLGRNGWLYEGAYIIRHNEPTQVQDDDLNRRVSELRQLQDRLRDGGIAFAVLIAPSKVSVYPEHLRPGALTRPPDAPGAYERVAPALAKAGVHVIDARRSFLDWKSGSGFPLFPRTGTHWSYAAVTRVAGDLFRELGRQNGRAFPEIVLTGVRRGGDPIHEENDLGELMNLWSWRRLAGAQNQPQVTVRRPAGQPPPRLLFVGDSFVHTLNRLLDREHAVAGQELFYYFKRRFSYPGAREAVIDEQALCLRDELKTYDAVVVEINEYWLPDIGFGFVPAALKALRGG